MPYVSIVPIGVIGYIFSAKSLIYKNFIGLGVGLIWNIFDVTMNSFDWCMRFDTSSWRAFTPRGASSAALVSREKKTALAWPYAVKSTSATKASGMQNADRDPMPKEFVRSLESLARRLCAARVIQARDKQSASAKNSAP